MVRAASRGFLGGTNLVISIRLEELLVRGVLSNPVRRNRGLIGLAEPNDAATLGESSTDAQDALLRTRRDAKGASRRTHRDTKGIQKIQKRILCRAWTVC
jgi:hypothetical protein